MIVDDDPAIRFILRMSLERAGYGVIEAKHGAEALQLVPETNPDLVIADIMMPVMGGLELIARLRSYAATASIPILVVSSRGEAAISADAIVRKPFRPDELLREVSSLLGDRA